MSIMVGLDQNLDKTRNKSIKTVLLDLVKSILSPRKINKLLKQREKLLSTKTQVQWPVTTHKSSVGGQSIQLPIRKVKGSSPSLYGTAVGWGEGVGVCVGERGCVALNLCFK